MNTTKTLNEQISEVLTAKMSKRAKKAAIVKLGISERNADQLIYLSEKNAPFDAIALTFGVEIECFNIERDALIQAAQRKSVSVHSEGYNHENNRRYFKLVSDASIYGENPVECVSPILKGAAGMDSLKAVCDALNECGARVNKSTGLHVHFDARGLSETHFCNIIKNYRFIERAIDTFMPDSRRANNNTYCKSMNQLYRLNWIDGVQTRDELIRYIDTRYYKVNVLAFQRHGTIEFRQHSGTTDFVKIERWIFFLRKLIAYSEKHQIEQVIFNIEDLPFLTDDEKTYFINRRNELNR